MRGKQPKEDVLNVLTNWKEGALADGLACYGRAEFFEAHEHWEVVWLKLEEPEKSFLQALIQVSSAFHHLKRGNRRGAVSLLRKALRRLDVCPAHFGGIAVLPLRVEIGAWLQGIEGGTATYSADFPKMCPIDEHGVGLTDSRSGWE